VALARALADAGEDRDAVIAATMAWISSITSTVLPTPAPPNIAALPPWAMRREQVDHLDAGPLKIIAAGQKPVKADWIWFTPMNTVNQRK
jgi:hypothetical protein